jgi:hypothetical protein
MKLDRQGLVLLGGGVKHRVALQILQHLATQLTLQSIPKVPFAAVGGVADFLEVPLVGQDAAAQPQATRAQKWVL